MRGGAVFQWQNTMSAVQGMHVAPSIRIDAGVELTTVAIEQDNMCKAHKITKKSEQTTHWCCKCQIGLFQKCTIKHTKARAGGQHHTISMHSSSLTTNDIMQLHVELGISSKSRSEMMRTSMTNTRKVVWSVRR